MPLTLVRTADPTLPDEALACRIADGDTDALQVLMRRYNRLLFRTARSILHEDRDAEDAVQDAFYLAYRAMGTFRGEARLSTWLVRIAANEAKRRLRRRKRHSEFVVLNDSPHRSGESPEPSMDDEAPASQHTEQPDDAVFRAQTRRLLETRIDALPAVYRTVFVLRAVEDMPVEEVAACLGIPAATVRSRFFRARGLLRAALMHDVGAGLEESFACAGARCDRIVAGVLARLASHTAR